ncbi:MAG: diguanylate cyclase [Oscillatoria sp. SIO1A7]|nr:diguanylate cyclase [Oscillatoria sp. SIO1A7]
MFVPSLKQAIKPKPIVALATTPTDKVISLMSQSRTSCVLIAGETADSGSLKMSSASQILGIFTERDVVGLIASDFSLKEIEVHRVMTKPAIVLKESPTQEQDIITVLTLFRKYRIRHLPILDRFGHLVGLIDQQSIRSILQPIDFMRLRRVAEVMNGRVIHAPLSSSVLHLAKLMAIYHVSCVVLAEALGSVPQEPSEASFEIWSDETCQIKPVRPVGIVTERDIVQFVNLGLDLENLTGKTVMSTPLFPIQPGESLWEAHQQMEQRRVRRLVVTGEYGELVGIITQTSLLQALDPIEMYAEIEMLQELLQQSESEREALLKQLIARNKLLESLALTDQLTGLPNRRAMDRAFPQILQTSAISLSDRHDSVWVFVIDVDYFKRVNDTYGHPTGDRLLKEIASRLQSQARGDSWLYRYGGEEFVCITPGLSHETAWDYGESLRLAIANKPFETADSQIVPITISIGAAMTTAARNTDKQTLLNLADTALYKAKREGRNRLRIMSSSRLSSLVAKD